MLWVALWVVLWSGLAGAAGAQVSGPVNAPFLFINQEQILVASGAGKALLAEEEEKRRKLVAEARSIDAAFEEEERALTERRKSMPAEEFRKLADDFDKRVVAARQRQDERSDALAQEIEQARRQFYAAVAPILVQLMDQYGARAIFDENSVLLADQRLNITDAVIEKIDALQSKGFSDVGPRDDNANEGDQP